MFLNDNSGYSNYPFNESERGAGSHGEMNN